MSDHEPEAPVEAAEPMDIDNEDENHSQGDAEAKPPSSAGRRRSGRARKQVIPLVSVGQPPQERVFIVEQGKGKALGTIDAINDQLGSHVARSKFLKRLHKVMFPSITVREKELKKEMRQFQGFSDLSQEHIDAVSKKLQANEVALLKQMAELLCLEKSGKKADLCERISEFLHKPVATKGSRAPAKKRTNKRKKSVGGKTKSTPSAYLLFCKSNRERVKADNPDAAFGEISKILGAEWSQLSNKEKSKYNTEAAALKEGSSPPKKRQRVSKKKPAVEEEPTSSDDSDEDVPLIHKRKPSQGELEAAIADIVESADLNTLTMKMVKASLGEKYGATYVKQNRALIKQLTTAEVDRH